MNRTHDHEHPFLQLPEGPRLATALAAVALPLATTACALADDPFEAGETASPIYSDVAGIGPLKGIEWSIDAPWRMERTSKLVRDPQYDPIPITFSIHDVSSQHADDYLPLHRFCGVYVLAIKPGQTWHNGSLSFIDASEFHEFEASRRWQNTGDIEPAPDGSDPHILRRVWADESPEDALNLFDWAEWHGTFTFQPPGGTPDGDDLRLIVLARVSKNMVCSEVHLSRFQLMYQLKQGRVTPYPPVSHNPEDAGDSFFFGDFLRVHYGADQLPRFDNRWVYGDVHYHSQGTDNEGESAISVRGSLAAAKAIGLDYVFATDHSSNSYQISGAGSLFAQNLPWWVDLIPYVGDYIENIELPWPLERDALRDLSPARFAFLRSWINDPDDGANVQVMSSGSLGRPSQIFQGQEIDVIPEISTTDAARGYFRYGANTKFRWTDACTTLPDFIKEYTSYDEECLEDLLIMGSASNRRAVRDVQGLGETSWYARQHILHLPSDAAEDKPFIDGGTMDFGGANHYLEDVLEDDVAPQDGYVFLAHPAEAVSGSGITRLGPDMVPYSDMQLRVAFQSRNVLGLEWWNGDSRVNSRSGSLHFPLLYGIGIPSPDTDYEVFNANLDWTWAEHNEYGLLMEMRDGEAMWDHTLLWGITPSITGTVPWLGSNEPRKVFMAGGSDAHGDLNHHRSGRFFGWGSSSSTALGTPRNLTYVGSERNGTVDYGAGTQATVTQSQVTQALASGQFSVTDGPALRIAVDKNANGVIDDDDVPMGGDYSLLSTRQIPLLVQWISNEEAGPVTTIDLYVGVQAGGQAGLVYAPAGHGPLGAGACIEHSGAISDADGNTYCPMVDGYVRDPDGTLRINVADIPGVTGYAGTVLVTLDPSIYRSFELECSTHQVPGPADDGEDPVWIDITNCDAENALDPNRMFVRAFAETDDTIDSFDTHRYAFTNPIWFRVIELTRPTRPGIGIITTGTAR